jgi:hypothetical protein
VTEEEEVELLVLKLDAVCAAAREDGLSFRQIFYALTWSMRDIMRSCDCPDCRKAALRMVKKDLPKELHEALAYAIEKYAGHVGHC